MRAMVLPICAFLPSGPGTLHIPALLCPVVDWPCIWLWLVACCWLSFWTWFSTQPVQVRSICWGVFTFVCAEHGLLCHVRVIQVVCFATSFITLAA
jgi:hypothetical protein